MQDFRGSCILKQRYNCRAVCSLVRYLFKLTGRSHAAATQTCNGWGQKVPLQFITSELSQSWSCHVTLHSYSHWDGPTLYVAELLRYGNWKGEVQSRSSVLLRKSGSKKSIATKKLHDLWETNNNLCMCTYVRNKYASLNSFPDDSTIH